MKNTECNIAYKLFILSISVINKELPWELAVNLRTEKNNRYYLREQLQMEKVEIVPDRRNRMNKNSELVKIYNILKNSEKEATANS